jgi:hypothetical protein
MRILFLMIGLVATSVLSSCSNSQNNTAQQQDSAYFPVNAYIYTQLRLLDSLQLPVTRYYTSLKGGDTTALSIAETIAQASPFLEQDISVAPLKYHYKESSFADESIPSITFNYQTQDSTLPLKRVDIVLKPDPVKSDKVKSIYMEKLYQKLDTLVSEKLYWRADHYYQIIYTKQGAGADPVISQLKVVWDPTD